MATLYSHTFGAEAWTGVNALPGTYYLSGLSPPGGTTHATVSSLTVMLHAPGFAGTYNMKCRIKNPEGAWGDYSYVNVTWDDETVQIITFTFANVEAKIDHIDRFEVFLARNSGPPYHGYTAHDETNTYFVVQGAWQAGEQLEAATLDAPADAVENYYLNSNLLAEFTWSHELDIGYHTVWFGPTGAMIEQTDRSRYSIISLKWYNGVTLEYDTEYQWKVVTNNGEDEVGSEIWTLNTIPFIPPLPGASGGGGGDPGGENNMVTLRRLVAVAANKFWYEDI